MQLEGKIEKSNIKYKWVTEPGACKKCKELEGKLFDTLEEFEATRPHPHCKCDYEIIKDDTEEQARIEEEINNLIRKQTYELEDIETCEKLIKRNLQNKHQLSTLQIEDLENKKLNITIIKQQITDNLNYLKDILNNSNKTNENINQTLKKIKNSVKNIPLNLKKEIINGLTDIAPIANLTEAAALWKLSSTQFKEGLEYISKNGKLLTSTTAINNPKLHSKVLEKLRNQNLKTNNIKGIWLNPNSSLSKKIIDTPALKNYIKSNKHKFKPNTTLASTSLEFAKIESPDIYVAIHKTDIENIYIDFHENFTATIIDTYDFNKNEEYFLVKWGNQLQTQHKIEPYYLIIDISIPKTIWENY